MSDSDFQGTIKGLSERVRERLKLGARERFILLFALFNAMFCLLFVLLLQNRQLIDDIDTIKATSTEAANKAAMKINGFESTIATLAVEIATLEGEDEESRAATLVPTVTSPTSASASNPPTSAPPTAVPPTLTPTVAPSPTATSVPPSPTSTPVPPTSTPEPTSTPKPKPKPKPPPTRPPDSPPTRPPNPPPTRPP